MTVNIIPLRPDETAPHLASGYLMVMHGIDARTTSDLCAQIESLVMR